MRRAVARGQQRRDEDQPVAHVSLDEKSFKHRHQFVTVLGDLSGRRVLDVGEGHTTKAAEHVLKHGLSESQRKGVQSVSMDMWFPYRHARERVLPEADTVHDRFHIGRFLNEAVDRTRRSEGRELRRKHDSSLRNTRYLWLRDPSKMTEKQRADLQKLEGLELETAKVWAFKESFRQFFDFETQSEATTFFDTWHDAARALRNVHLTQAAITLKDHFEGLISYIRHKVTNAFAEAINGQIQRIKANARGYRKFENFRTAILFFLGKFDLYPHKSP